MKQLNTVSWLIISASLIYLVNFVIGLFVPHEFLSSPSDKVLLLNRSTWFFFKNNIQVVTKTILGSITLGTTTFTSLSFNSLYLGFIIRNTIENNASINTVSLLVLPHCIFEIPAIIIAGAAGFKIPYEVTRYLVGKKDQILNSQDIKEYIALALISIALIVIAAWIEANITMRIAESMLNE